MQTTGITSHYLQARRRNILQEEGISSRGSNPPYLLKVISSWVLSLSGKRPEEPTCHNETTFGCKTQELVRASSTSARLQETMDRDQKKRTDRKSLSRRIEMTCNCGRSLKGTAQQNDIFKTQKAVCECMPTVTQRPCTCMFFSLLSTVSSLRSHLQQSKSFDQSSLLTDYFQSEKWSKTQSWLNCPFSPAASVCFNPSGLTFDFLLNLGFNLLSHTSRCDRQRSQGFRFIPTLSACGYGAGQIRDTHSVSWFNWTIINIYIFILRA